MRELVQGAHALIGNPGAVVAMLGVEADTGEGESPEALRCIARRLGEELGCRWVALTRREVISASEHGWSAVLLDSRTGQAHQSTRYQVRLVDRVGGGDSFAAGLIHALLAGREAAAALEFATAASALKLTIPGDFNRVSADEVDRLVASSSPQ